MLNEVKFEFIVMQTGVTSIDITGVETLIEVRRNMEAKEIKVW